MHVPDERNNVLDLRSTTSCSLERWLSFTEDERDLVGLGAVEMRRSGRDRSEVWARSSTVLSIGALESMPIKTVVVSAMLLLHEGSLVSD